MKKTFIYEIAVPVKETWIMHVEASSKKEALERYHAGTPKCVEQNCSEGGWPYGRTIKVLRKWEKK